MYFFYWPIIFLLGYYDFLFNFLESLGFFFNNWDFPSQLELGFPMSIKIRVWFLVVYIIIVLNFCGDQYKKFDNQ